jgi:hypothetical protein
LLFLGLAQQELCPPRLRLFLHAVNLDVIIFQQRALGQLRLGNGIVIIGHRAQRGALGIDQAHLKVDHIFLRDQAGVKTFFLQTEIFFGEILGLARVPVPTRCAKRMLAPGLAIAD